MKNLTTIQAVLGAAVLFSLTACGDNGGGDSDGTGNNTGTDPTAATEPTSTTVTTTDPSTTEPTTTNPPTTTTPDPTTTDPTTTTTTTTTTGDTTTEDPDTTTGDNGFVFQDAPYDQYEQIDRHGAVEAGTAGIAAAQGLGFNMGSDISIRDAYNKSNPVEDRAGKWLPEIAMSITFFHDALDDDLIALKLVPATIDETVMQAGPVILPDTIKYDPSMPTGYPNGRRLEDPVVDLTLAAVLLKLGPKQPLTLLADLPLNPPKNDVDFLPEFPYLAPPHK